MDLSRRRFLGLGIASATTYFFAPIGGWHSDTIINPNNMPIARVSIISDQDVTIYRGKYHEQIWENGDIKTSKVEMNNFGISGRVTGIVPNPRSRRAMGCLPNHVFQPLISAGVMTEAQVVQGRKLVIENAQKVRALDKRRWDKIMSAYQLTG